MFDPYGQVTGGEGVEVVGNDQVGFAREQKEKEPDIEIGVKERPPNETQPHTVQVIGPGLQGKAPFQLSAYQKHLEAEVQQGQAGTVDPLIGGQVVGYTDDGGVDRHDRLSSSTVMQVNYFYTFDLL